MDKLSNPTQNYTVVPNEIFQMHLHASTRFLYIYLISRPDNWNVNAKNIMNVCGCGRDKAYKMLQELKDAGMLSYHRKIGGGGVYTLHEITTSGFSASDISASDKSAHIVNTDKAVNTELKLLVQNEFARWYFYYPNKKGKPAALKAFIKATKKMDGEQVGRFTQMIIDDTQNRAKNEDSWQRDNGRYIPMPATYINGERWTDSLTQFEVKNSLPKSDEKLAEFAVQHNLHAPGKAPQHLRNASDYRNWIQQALGGT